jgi:hypothetical protein
LQGQQLRIPTQLQIFGKNSEIAGMSGAFGERFKTGNA